MTGGYDGQIRVWTYSSPSIEDSSDKLDKHYTPKLLYNLSGHKGLINSIVLDEKGDKMYSGDSNGLIKVWDTSLLAESGSKKGGAKESGGSVPCLSTIDTFLVSFSFLICSINEERLNLRNDD
jgi:WD40 repeat protein